MKNSASAIAALSAAFALAAVAQTNPPPLSDIPATADSSATQNTVQFVTVDQNKDGRISRAEAMSHGSQLGGVFATLDADRDTYLSQSEYSKWSGMGATPPANTATPPGNSMPPTGGPSTRTPAPGQD